MVDAGPRYNQSDATVSSLQLRSTDRRHDLGSRPRVLYSTGMLRTELGRFSNSWGLIEYREFLAAAEVFDRLFDQMDSHLVRGAFRPAFDVTTAIIEEAAIAITHTEESAREMGRVVHHATGKLQSIAEAEIDDTLRYDTVNHVERTVASDEFFDVADSGRELWRLSTARSASSRTAGGETRIPTGREPRQILSLARLPISPRRQIHLSSWTFPKSMPDH